MKTMLAILLLVVSCQANAVTAYFTGNARYIQSVTYRMVWQCEYTYSGNNFYLLFDNYCPSLAEVR